jgi:hypothetical protein
LAKDGPRAKEPQEMMTNRLEDLWKSADDGASAPIGPLANRTEAEFDQLLDAWFVERRNSIEFEILLDESRKLMRRLLAECEVSTTGQKRARRLIQVIETTLRTASANGD